MPSRIRQGLNVESGLNDGICVPLLFIVLAVAEADAGEVGRGARIRLVAEEIGYGILGGVVAGAVAGAAVVLGSRWGLIERSWLQIIPVAGAALAYGACHPTRRLRLHRGIRGRDDVRALRRCGGRRDVTLLTDELGEALNASRCSCFGAVLLWPALDDLTWRIGLDAVASLTVVRMLPVALAMRGTRARRPTIAFLGWFGPRGLASIVFAVIVVEEADLPAHQHHPPDDLRATVGLSCSPTALTAAPLARRYAAWVSSPSGDAMPAMERARRGAPLATVVPWRAGTAAPAGERRLAPAAWTRAPRRRAPPRRRRGSKTTPAGVFISTVAPDPRWRSERVAPIPYRFARPAPQARRMSRTSGARHTSRRKVPTISRPRRRRRRPTGGPFLCAAFAVLAISAVAVFVGLEIQVEVRRTAEVAIDRRS